MAASDVKVSVCAELTLLAKPMPVNVAIPSTAFTVRDCVSVEPLNCKTPADAVRVTCAVDEILLPERSVS